jgi:iron complex transport system substrate-binding protein
MTRVLPLLCLLLLSGCSRVHPPPPAHWSAIALPGAPASNLIEGCVAHYAADVDYFPDKVTFTRSTQLRVEYARHYKLVQFDPGVKTGETQTIALVQCGTPRPSDLPPHTVVVDVPIRRLATVNETIYGALADLDIVDTLVGVPNPEGVTVPAVKARLASGAVVALYGYAHSSIEAILALAPDVYLSFYSPYPEFHVHPTLRRIGINALPHAEHLESHPLGRAEWIKFLALLTNREARADEVFNRIEREYEGLRARVPADLARRPVLAGAASARNIWDLFGGDNFRAALIHDAGGEFVLRGFRSASGHMLLPFERVYASGHDAPVWLGGIQGIASVDRLRGEHVMYPFLRSVRERNVHGWDRGYLGYWAYPAVDQSMTRPQWMLEDAIRILHPSLLPPGDLHFLRTLQ